MKNIKKIIIDMKLPRSDRVEFAASLQEIDGVEVDIVDGAGDYSKHGGKLITIGYYILFPLTISFPSDTKRSSLLDIKRQLVTYLEEKETAITIRNKKGSNVVIQGPLSPSTKANILTPLFDELNS